MGAFQYVAVDPRGKEQKGVLEGDSARHVRQLLRERSLMPVQIDEVECHALSLRQRGCRASPRRSRSASHRVRPTTGDQSPAKPSSLAGSPVFREQVVTAAMNNLSGAAISSAASRYNGKIHPIR